MWSVHSLFFILSSCKVFVDCCFPWKTIYVSPHEISHPSFWLQHLGKNTSELCNEVQWHSQECSHSLKYVTWNSLIFLLLLCFHCFQIFVEKYVIHFISVPFISSVYKTYVFFFRQFHHLLDLNKMWKPIYVKFIWLKIS